LPRAAAESHSSASRVNPFQGLPAFMICGEGPPLLRLSQPVDPGRRGPPNPTLGDADSPRTRPARLEMFFESPADTLIGADP
jgi:hypothetical protein